MGPKAPHIEDAAILVRPSALSELIERLTRSEHHLCELQESLHAFGIGIREELTEIKNVLPLKRRKMSAATKCAHLECIPERFDGRCPCCRETQILDVQGRPLPLCHEEHFVNRHENALDKTWLVCQGCNLKKTGGRLEHVDVEAFFRAYQAVLRKHMAEHSGPYQIRMGERVRVQ